MKTVGGLFEHGILSGNRSENALTTIIFAGYLFNEHIFPDGSGIKILLNRICEGKHATSTVAISARLSISFYVKPRDIIRKRCGLLSDGAKYGHGHYDVAAFYENAAGKNTAVFFEIKYLSDVDPKQLMHQVRLAEQLKQEPELNLEEIVFVTVATHANLKWTRAVRIDAAGRVEIVGMGELASWISIKTWDDIALAVLDTAELSEFHDRCARRVLRYMADCQDVKHLKSNGSLSTGSLRQLLTSSRAHVESFLSNERIIGHCAESRI